MRPLMLSAIAVLLLAGAASVQATAADDRLQEQLQLMRQTIDAQHEAIADLNSRVTTLHYELDMFMHDHARTVFVPAEPPLSREVTR